MIKISFKCWSHILPIPLVSIIENIINNDVSISKLQNKFDNIWRNFKFSGILPLKPSDSCVCWWSDDFIEFFYDFISRGRSRWYYAVKCELTDTSRQRVFLKKTDVFKRFRWKNSHTFWSLDREFSSVAGVRCSEAFRFIKSSSSSPSRFKTIEIRHGDNRS